MVLVLQGGGALGAYQAGAYMALHEAGYQMDWVTGISIGSINAALIAGNTRAHRPERLRSFWERVSSDAQIPPLFPGKMGRRLANEMNVIRATFSGVSGFFRPYNPFRWVQSTCFGTKESLSFYDTAPLRATLCEYVDFDLLNRGDIRFSVGAVNVCSGNVTYFDSEKMTIAPEHVMASGALPEGFPPIEIDGCLYWDGGLVSNTPLQYVVDVVGFGEEFLETCQDMCIFQVDLFSARGALPQSIMDVTRRKKDIRFSSRTRLNTDIFKEYQEMRSIIRDIAKKYGDNITEKEHAALLRKWSCDLNVTIAHLIYRQKKFETSTKDCEFSRASVEDHWRAGEADVRFMLVQKQWQTRKKPADGLRVFDFDRHSEDDE